MNVNKIDNQLKIKTYLKESYGSRKESCVRLKNNNCLIEIF